MKRVIVLVALVLIMGLSLLAIQCGQGSKSPSKGLPSGAIEQLKMPLKGFHLVEP